MQPLIIGQPRAFVKDLVGQKPTLQVTGPPATQDTLSKMSKPELDLIPAPKARVATETGESSSSMKHVLLGAAAVAAGVGAVAVGAQHVPALWSSLVNVVQPATQGISHWISSLSTPAIMTVGVPAAAGAAITGSAGLMAGAMANDSGRMSDAAHMGVVLGLVTVTGAVGAAVGGGLGYGLLRLFA